MLLAIDIGNTHTAAGLYRGAEMQCHWRLRTVRDRTADELAILLHNILTMGRYSFQDITAVVMASVVPTLNGAFISFCARYLQREPLMVEKGVKTMIEVRLDHPEEVGADRIVNAVAAYHKYGKAVIIVDFGTAITFDCVSSQGHYLGGAIAPGLGISLDALHQRAAKLPRIDISHPPPGPLGTNTVDAMKSGILFGFGGLVDGIVRRLRGEFNPEKPLVIATGGMGELIAAHAETIDRVEPMLTLEGLRIIHEFSLSPG